MSSLNKILLIGRLGQDPAIKVTSNGKDMMTFTMATSFGPKSKTEWHRIKAFDQLATTCAFFKKGHQVYVEGYVSYGEYTTDTGERRFTTDIIANRMMCLTSKTEAQQSQNRQPPQNDRDVTIDDLPF